MRISRKEQFIVIHVILLDLLGCWSEAWSSSSNSGSLPPDLDRHHHHASITTQRCRLSHLSMAAAASSSQPPKSSKSKGDSKSSKQSKSSAKSASMKTTTATASPRSEQLQSPQTIDEKESTPSHNKVSSSSSHNHQTEKALAEMRRRNQTGGALTQSYCDGVLGLCVAQEEWESVLEVLDMMKYHQLEQQTTSTYRACLQACLEAGNGEAALEIYQAMQTALVYPQPYDVGLCVTAMCRQDNEAIIQKGANTHKNNNNAPSRAVWWRKAWNLIKSYQNQNVSTTANTNETTTIPLQAYHVILERMVDARQWKEAVRLLRILEDANPAHGSSSSSNNNNSKALSHHPSPDAIVYRKVIECCVASQQAEQAAQVLQSSMKDRGVAPTSYTCELVVLALSKKLAWRRALQLLDTVYEKYQIPKTVITYNTIISACARAREVGMAKSLLARMQSQDGLRPDEVTYNSVIGACAGTARWKDALALLDQCYREPGVTPNIYIYTNAMRACAKGGNTQRALSLLQVVKDKGLPLDTYCYTAVIDACAKAKQWKKALSLLEEMQAAGIEPSQVTYSVTISACGNGGQWQRALDLLHLMKSKEMSVNVITYNAALTALSKASRQQARHVSKLSAAESHPRSATTRAQGGTRMGFRKSQVSTKSVATKQQYSGDLDIPPEGLAPKALSILEDMRAGGLEPDGFCYSSAISCCGAEGRWKEALKLMDKMKRGGPRTRPNRIAYTAAITACGKAGKATEAVNLFQAMKNEGLSADRVAYNALFSALRVAGDADQSFALWGEMCGTGSSTTSTSIGDNSRRNAMATAQDFASPDIITVTDCLATLSRANRLTQLDQVFREAVRRGIILRSNSLDLDSETDLSGMSLPVARAAIRYILHQTCQEVQKKTSSPLQDMTFITGVGRAQQRRREDTGTTTTKSGTTGAGSGSAKKDPTTSLREYVQEVLQTDFTPSIESVIPRAAQGTIEIPKANLSAWIRRQQKK